MLKKLITLICCFLLLQQSNAQTQVREIKNGEPLRKTILEVVRKPTNAELGQNIEFVVSLMRQKGDWVFVNGMLQQKGGKPLDSAKFVDKDYKEMSAGGIFDDNFQAVLQKKNGKWIIVKRALGCTDVCWLEWTDDKNIPKGIFPNN